MDKNLALIYEFKSAPEEVKKIAEQHKENWMRSEKAKSQFNKWKAEKLAADSAYNESLAQLAKAIEAWDPAETKGEIEEIEAVKAKVKK